MDLGKTIVLVADDEPSTRALVAQHLRTRGYMVVEASDGDEALERAYEHLPHVMVLDVMMPGMSGWEVCRRIRETVSLAHTGVVMLTGIGEALNEMTSPLYGADAYIDKPFEFSVLDRTIAETIERRKDFVGRLDGADVEIITSAVTQESDDGAASPEPVAPKPAKKAAPKPAKKVAKKPAKKAAPKPAKKVAKKPAKKAAPKPAKKVAKKPAKKVAKKPAKKVTPKPAKKVAKKPAKKVAKKPAKKAGKAKRR